VSAYGTLLIMTEDSKAVLRHKYYSSFLLSGLQQHNCLFYRHERGWSVSDTIACATGLRTSKPAEHYQAKGKQNEAEGGLVNDFNPTANVVLYKSIARQSTVHYT
jgi:hypothetical protein